MPLYWLGEPGRQEGFDNLTNNQFASRGGEAYEELCAQCHGAAGVGGQAAYTVLDEQGRYIAGVNWTAPALNAILYRFTKTEVTHILNYGRPQSPMPAWGGPGGGPLTTQQIEELVAYLAEIQLTPEQMVEFWADWNSTNQFNDLAELKECNVYRLDIMANADTQAKYDVSAIPTVIIFDNGIEKARFNPNIMFKLDACKKTVQHSVDTIKLSKFQ